MIRINVGIPPEHLPDQLLIVEHKHLARLPKILHKIKTPPPENFCVGWGHIPFMLDKGGYTLYRYHEVYEECIRRGFNVNYYADNWDVYEEFKHLDESAEVEGFMRQRILKKCRNKKYTYEGMQITSLFITNLLYYGIK